MNLLKEYNEFIKGIFGMQVRVSEEEIGRCGCGRSASGYCDGSHGLTEEQWKKEKKLWKKAIKKSLKHKHTQVIQ